jgi:hypothetical protein
LIDHWTIKYENATNYRLWARQKIAQRAPTVSASFNLGEWFVLAEDAWEPVPATHASGGSAAWGRTADGYLVQTTDAGSLLRRDAPKLIRAEVFDNVALYTSIKSNDNARAGVVVRYVDPRHYYQLSISEAREYAVFEKRKGDIFTELGDRVSLPGFDWSDQIAIEVIAEDERLSARIDAVAVEGEDWDYPVGRVGVFTRFLEYTMFDYFYAGAIVPDGACEPATGMCRVHDPEYRRSGCCICVNEQGRWRRLPRAPDYAYCYRG